MSRLHRILVGAVMGCAGVPGMALAVEDAGDCAGLKAITAAASTITSADSITAPARVSDGVTVRVPFCRVQGVARPSSDSQIKFEVWLPPTAAAWNGRLKVNGTGGYAGATPHARLAQDIADGFVTAGSNMGHDGGENAAWTRAHPEKVKDWGLRAHHSVATAAKALSLAFYGQPVRHAYFEGCSNGGRQALMMAQNYPDLFDGIVAGAPSNFYPDLLMWLLWAGKLQVPVLGQPPVLSAEKRTLITQRVLAACDADDGLADGQITNPRACRFNIDSMGSRGDNSLTEAELKVVKAMYAGTTSEGGAQRHTGAKLGSESAWAPDFADGGGYGRFIGHFVYDQTSPPFEWRRGINFSTVYDRVKAALAPITAAPSPDLSAFKRRGGKLIQYHGWNDAVVPPDGSINYLHALTQFEQLRALPKAAFDAQVDALSPQGVVATAEAFGAQVRQYHRLFMMPGVGHCGGGSGPAAIGGGMPEPTPALRDAEHQVVSAVIRWVEQGVAPDRIVATRFGADRVIERQRPLCAYPAQAAYKGSGDINMASNFACVTPKLQARSIAPGDILQIQDALRQRALILPNR